MNKLFDYLIHFVSACLSSSSSENLYHQFVDYLEKSESIYSYSNWQATLRLPVDLELFAFEMIKEAESNSVSSAQLRNYLEVAYKMAKSQLESEPRIFPVWTGPLLEKGPIKLKTYETVKYLIDSAESEVFIVGYNFSFKNDDIKKLLRSIEQAVERNCRVNIIVNKVESNFKEIMDHWEKEQYQLNVYHWIGSKEEDFTSLHAKIIIIDQQKLLLTSANFSYHGFQKNIETGVVIENHQISRDIWNQYYMLMKENQMRKAY
ncbi:phosphatidylserine/phosphatidylglycerophosphate/cardiolipin synthase-like enzyme [Salirhabdus euzebyi]|uniref:phospholipase D n=1 Tax=Salirhabdus euzebyi TaxID=394506 RepID=A0A841Q0Z7_9BACI|nr:phospholipase D-like domain-containing protein [Salirhabdus euzebyi]MBB6451613.1 phosphatidylserine/phosphatidylglycerophosphate/cardiolipin synthase-like enzyme [Salirhabdus euzebyi]